MSWLVVGLGNPGAEYASTRHNIGFLVLDELGRRAGASFREKFQGELARTQVAGEDTTLLRPMTYMNHSGISVGRAASFYKLDPTAVIVIHDDLDLPYGEVRLKTGGGHGGHNGLRSIFAHFGRDFHRVRCGIGRPQFGGNVTGWVLGGFSPDERVTLPTLIETAADAVEALIHEGPRRAMSRFNKKASGGRTKAAPKEHRDGQLE